MLTVLKTLESYYEGHDGLVSDKWDIYLSVYSRLFSLCRDQSIRLLEVGVQNGGSLELWVKYFVNANIIVGCDVDPSCAKLTYDSEKIKIILGDIGDAKVLNEIFKISNNFDVVIDDGSHASSDIINTFCNLFPALEYDGIYVIEDLHCSYWKEFGGGLFCPGSAMNFFKQLADILNFEHWGLESSRVDFLKSFGIDGKINEVALSEVHSIEFLNSMCILRKKPSGENVLGRRHVVGRQELVCPVLHMNNSLSQPLCQSGGARQPLDLILRNIFDIIKSKFGSENSIILEQREKIKNLEHDKIQLDAKVLRAEGQVDLLKELLLAADRSDRV